MKLMQLCKLALLCALLSACGTGEDSKAAAFAAAVPAAAQQPDQPEGYPPIKAVLVYEALLGGKNIAKASYAKTVEICRNSGNRIEPLTAEQIARLDTREVTLAMEGDREYVREVSWSEEHPIDDPSQLCLFRFKQTVNEYMRDGLIEGSGSTGSGWQQWRLEFAGDIVPIDLAKAEAVTRSLGVEATGVPVYQGPVRRTILGQPCAEWSLTGLRSVVDGRQRSCIWTGGARWGIPPVPSDVCSIGGADRWDGPIPLEIEPIGDRSVSCRMRAKFFSVGVPLSDAEFRPRKDYGGGK